MNKYIQYALFLCCTLLCACNSVHIVELNTVRPAQVEYHKVSPAMVVINNSEVPNSSDFSRYVDENGKQYSMSYNADSVPTYFAMTLGRELYGSDAFSNVEVLLLDSTEITGIAGIDQQVVDNWHRNYPNEVYLAINDIKPQAVMRIENYEGFSGAEIKIVSTAHIQCFVPGLMTKNFSVTDTVGWYAYGDTPTMARMELPTIEDCIAEALESLSARCTQNFATHKRIVERYVFITGHPAMQDAFKYWSYGQYTEASYIWEYVYENAKDKGRIAKAAINLALYHELRDNYSEALEYAQKAHTLFVDENYVAEAQYASSYCKDLQQRIEEEAILNRTQK